MMHMKLDIWRDDIHVKKNIFLNNFKIILFGQIILKKKVLFRRKNLRIKALSYESNFYEWLSREGLVIILKDSRGEALWFFNF